MSIVSYPDRAIQEAAGGDPVKFFTIRRFSVAPSMNGYEVVDSDGRPLADGYAMEEAEAVAAELNDAAMVSRKSLAKAIAAL